MFHDLFDQFPLGEYPGCFQLSISIGKAAGDILVPTFLYNEAFISKES